MFDGLELGLKYNLYTLIEVVGLCQVIFDGCQRAIHTTQTHIEYGCLRGVFEVSHSTNHMQIEEQLLGGTSCQRHLDTSKQLFSGLRLNRLLWAWSGKSGCTLDIATLMNSHISGEVAFVQVVGSYCMTSLVISKTSSINSCQLTDLAQAVLVNILCLYEVLVGDHFTPIEVRDNHCFIHHVLNSYRCIVDHTL